MTRIVVVYPNDDPSIFMVLAGNDCGLSWRPGVRMKTLEPGYSWFYDFDAKSACKSLTGLQVKTQLNGTVWEVAQRNHQLNRVVAGKTATLYPWYFARQGGYEVLEDSLVCSKQNLLPRQVVFYAGPPYLENSAMRVRRVLIMHDGQNVFNASTAFMHQSWHAQPTLDGLIDAGTMEVSTVVFAFYNTPNRIAEYTPTKDKQYGGGDGNAYLDCIEQEGFAMIKSFLGDALEEDAEFLMLGSSLGGLISCYAGWTRKVYSGVGCMSSSFWWNAEHFNAVFLKNGTVPPALSPLLLNVYLDSGTAPPPDGDDELQTLRVRSSMLKQLAPSHVSYYLDHGGGHNEYYWGRRFWRPMLALLPRLNQSFL